jgi:peptidylprolyl isomerase
MSRVRTWSLVVLTASVVGLAGCGSSSSSPTTTAVSSPTTTAVSSNPTTGAATSTSGAATTLATVPAQDLSPAGTSGQAPSIVVPSGTPPTQLESSDLIVGTGPAAKAGDSLTVQYVLATYSSGKVVQSSWTSQPFTFTLDANPPAVITGWDQGVAGMKVGGRRELIIPPSLGYGANAQGPGIAANDTLVFIIDLLKIN